MDKETKVKAWVVQKWRLKVHNLTLAIFFVVLTIIKP
jgi:hypothetical protein